MAARLDPQPRSVALPHAVFRRIPPAPCHGRRHQLFHPAYIVRMNGGDHLTQLHPLDQLGRIERERPRKSPVGNETVRRDVPHPGTDNDAGIQRQLEALPALVHLRYVARYGKQLFRQSIRPKDRRDLNVPPPLRAGNGLARALEAADPAGLGPLDCLSGRRVAGTVPGIRPRTAPDGRGIVHLHQPLPGLGHEQEVALEVEHLDAIARRGQHAPEELGILPAFLGLLPLLRPVAQHLDEAGHLAAVAQRHHLAARPKARAVLAEVPTLVVAPPRAQRVVHLRLRYTLLPVGQGEERAGRLAQHLRLRPAQDPVTRPRSTASLARPGPAPRWRNPPRCSGSFGSAARSPAPPPADQPPSSNPATGGT